MGEKDIAQKILEAYKDEQVSVMECQQKLVHGIDVKGCCDYAGERKRNTDYGRIWKKVWETGRNYSHMIFDRLEMELKNSNL